jgi:hypothetical protein
MPCTALPLTVALSVLIAMTRVCVVVVVRELLSFRKSLSELLDAVVLSRLLPCAVDLSLFWSL